MTGGFVAMALIAFATSFVAIAATRALLPIVGDIGAARSNRLDAAIRLKEIIQSKLSNSQAFLLTGRREFLVASRNDRAELLARLRRLRETAPSDRTRYLIERIEVREIEHQASLDLCIQLRESEGTPDAVVRFYSREVLPRRVALDASVDDLIALNRSTVASAQLSVHDRIRRSQNWVIAIATIATVLFLAMVLALRNNLLTLYRSETQQKLAAAGARETAERLGRAQAEARQTTRLIVERALDAVISTDEGGRITGWNREAQRIFGWSAEEANGQVFQDLILCAAERPGIVASLEEHAASGHADILDRRIELSAVRRDGSEFPIEMALTAIQRGGVQFSAFIRDISDRKRIENQIRASEEEFRAAFEYSGVGHAQVDLPTGRFMRVNPKLTEITGYSADELAERTLVSIVHPDDVAADVIGVQSLVRSDSIERSVEARLCRRDGQVVWAHVTLTLIRDLEERPLRVLAVVQDLSELRRAQSALQATEERFQLMADSAPVLVWMSGPDQLHTWFNRPWQEFTGRSMTQELGSGWMDGVHPDDRELCASTYATAFARRRPFTAEYRLHRADGRWRWIIDNGIPLYGEAGEFTGFIGSCIDITDRKRAEDERERLLERERTARGEAERASRMKDEFLATLSHELRTPLQAMLGWSRLLGSEQLDETQVRRGLEVIERNVTLQKRLIEDLLDMSRVIQGKMRLDVRSIQLNSVVEAAIEVVRPAAEAKTIRLTTALDPEAGPILADPQRIQQVIWNLLSNAIKFTPAGGEIEVRIVRSSENVQLSVRDSGQGIKREFLPHVFERFRQQDASTTRRQGGLGLGLAIVRNLVELHGGHVSAQSHGEGKGAQFMIDLPIRVPFAETPATIVPHEIEPSPAGHDPVGPTTLVGRRILVVDDEPDACELLQRVFSERGAEVVTVQSVSEAMAAYEGFAPHILISDIGMPGEDGYELIRRIRSREVGTGRSIQAIALTAFARPEDRALALNAGFQMHIAKPVEPAKLTATVARMVLAGPASRAG